MSREGFLIELQNHDVRSFSILDHPARLLLLFCTKIIPDTISTRMQAAKYFTFIFFGLSVFVILLFGGFVLCHCYRRLRYDREDDSRPQVRSLLTHKRLVTPHQRTSSSRELPYATCKQSGFKPASALSFMGIRVLHCTIACFASSADAAGSLPPADTDRRTAPLPVRLHMARDRVCGCEFMLSRHAGVSRASGTVTPSR